jgi:ElaB/YqjD/DUF883 family membrane-anchored ribosome-binding protein
MNPAASSESPGMLRQEIDRLKADLERLRADFTDLGGDAVHAAKAGAEEARERVAEKARAAAAKGRESIDAIEDQVAAHPFLSLGAAFAVGLALGVAFSHKDRT